MKIIKLLLILLTGFISGVIFTTWYFWPAANAIKVLVINSSGMAISSVSITHGKGSVTTNGLANGARQVIPVHVSGESIYSITVTLANGTTLSGEGGYVEPGYKVTETVYADKIEHRFVSFY